MSDDDLFDASAKDFRSSRAPLADRMRPRTLDEFIGQEHILGQGRLLRRSIEADRVTSMIFFGPPGTGKTTLARIIAGSTKSHFVTLNAVLSGVKDIRAAIAEAETRQKHHQQRSILFLLLFQGFHLHFEIFLYRDFYLTKFVYLYTIHP